MNNLSPAELDARLRLHGLPELGPIRFLRLIEAFGSASSALAAPAGAWRTLGLPAEAAAARRSAEVRERAADALRWLEAPRRHLLMWDDPAYPALLGEVSDAPPLLFVEGAPTALERPQLAMVGSRRASPAGLGSARSFARSLARGGFAITSGLALGIDGAAHEGALEVGGVTLAVLGTGLRTLYPRRHAALARRIVEGGGALVSELPLDSPPLPANFPRRNRIISGLSLGVLVVEASPASGSLITARLAAEQGREVYAIPGSIHHPGARGCHQLIRDGALLVESVEHVLEALRGWTQAGPAEAPVASLAHPLLELLRAAPYSSEGLAAASGWALPEVLAALTELELDGRVACEAGTWVHRSG
ncbi:MULTISPECIES: DNA-processing protein DprA [Pseudomonas aeruginosa group]|uniref:DNA-processing protein DprA n=1 Tax=Pseudomonas aeruginosa group TaxID=136841 RepID=UPI0006B9E321|nr:MULTISPECIES: DNA-processing protein DprA [Pseudomonas aeruginosa group]KPD27894.1 DNA processing protein DprA [Pseudomonas paraeruginosa]KQB32952.1 DNA processing protein DprA [Pseudomonas paraeruginosa]MDT1023914.1 DNA-processing protein DprA [Pseudomonas paraeruginosa]PHJ31086.1 DNA protecting protein DprA [Pseudomonas paraeruginosa]QQV48766.1 DNA-protecting protein DprA [Pseudomonas aeruginosa]